MSNTVPTTTPGTTSADPAKLTPEAVIGQLRALRSQIETVAPLSKEQRALLKTRLRTQPTPVVNASINVMGVVDSVSQVIGQPLDDVRQVQNEALRWDAVIEEARAFLTGLEGANLVRRQRLAVIGRQAYTIGTQLALDPANAVLVPHVEEVKRLKVASRRKKTAPAPQTPDTPTTPKA
ncbi:MAG TPA: hypothetical protein VHT23_12430 [Gemmatimonadaceae bacterium]|jgi:hypothetical protein|nr:hypothetical protein [Gemmatimonadaceae bacterium]